MEIDEYSILKKKRKKNGFAATALLISIAIALLVMVGAVLVLSKVNDKDHVTLKDNETVTESGNNSDSTTCEGLVKEIVFNDNLKTIKEAAISYFTNERLPQTIGDKVKISLGAMQDKKLLLNVRDASANSCDKDKSYVEVTKEKDEYVMKIFLSCSDLEDYIIVHLGCYDYCDKDVCEKEVEPEKLFEYEYKKTTSCVMSDWSNWGNWKTTREKTSNLKKEDIKTETSSKESIDKKDAIANTSYNCDRYPGYTRVGTECIKETTVTDIKDATPSKYSYNCDKYPGYDLVGSKCVKETKTTDIKSADVTYNCDNYSGYTLDGKVCKKTTTDTKDANVTYNCNKYPGYTLDGTKCKKTTTITDTKDANVTYNCKKYSGYTLDGTKCKKTTTDTVDGTPVYGTKFVDYTCYKQECTTKTVFSCPSGKACGNYPQTSCQYVGQTCQSEEKYLDHYDCPSGYSPNGSKCTKSTTDTKDATKAYDCNKYSGYDLDGTKCKKTTTTTDTKDATKVYDCKKYSGYDLDGTKCKKTTTDKKDAAVEYNCKKYPGYDLDGTKCKKTTITKDEKEATKVPGGYVCPEGYTQNDKTCTKVTVTKDKKNADKKVTYSCPVGYTQNDKTCSKKISSNTKITYYRYATRTCDGGTTSIKWSTSNNDSILKAEGYKLTGNKREVKEIIK